MSKPFCAHATLTEPTPSLHNILLADTQQTKNTCKVRLKRIAHRQIPNRGIAIISKKNNTSPTHPSSSITVLWLARPYAKACQQDHPKPQTLTKLLTALPQLDALLMGYPNYDLTSLKAKTCAPDLEKKASCPYIDKVSHQTHSVNSTAVDGVTTYRSPLC